MNQTRLLKQQIKEAEDNYIKAMKEGKLFWQLKDIHIQIAGLKRTLKTLEGNEKKPSYLMRLSARWHKGMN